MYLTCPLCRTEWVLTSRICASCDKIRHYMEIYSQNKILEILDKVLVVQQHKDKEVEKKEIENKIEIEQKAHFADIVRTIEQQSLKNAKIKTEVADDQVDYQKPLTRNSKK